MTAQELVARLDRLPMSRFHRRIVICLAFAFFCELIDLNEFAYAAPGLIKFLHISVNDVAAITAAGFLGMALGAASGGWVADTFGRQRSLLWGLAWFSLFSILNGLAFNVATLLVARFLTGMGLSSLTVISITYLAELMPKQLRGRLQAVTLALGALGVPLIAAVALLVVPLGPLGWRVLFAFGGLGLGCLPLIHLLPESPRWLLTRGHHNVAEHMLLDIEKEVAREVGQLPPVLAIADPAGLQQDSLRLLFAGTLLPRTVMLWLVWIFQTLGVYGFSSWIPTLLVTQGLSLVKSLTFTYEQGKYGEAESLFQRAIRLREKRLGPEHPHLVSSLIGLANLYFEQGRYEEAEPLYQRSLQILDQHLRSEHHDVARSLTGLANLYLEQGRYEEAEPLFQRALHISKQAKGLQHPETAEIIHDFAQLQVAQGNKDEAKSLYIHALTICEQTLGAQHPKTTKIRMHLITLLQELGQYEEAAQIGEAGEP